MEFTVIEKESTDLTEVDIEKHGDEDVSVGCLDSDAWDAIAAGKTEPRKFGRCPLDLGGMTCDTEVFIVNELGVTCTRISQRCMSERPDQPY